MKLLDIKPGQLYHHWKGGRKAKIVLIGETTDGTPIVGYVHKGDAFRLGDALYAHNPEFGQSDKPFAEYNYFGVIASGDRSTWEAIPYLLKEETDSQIRDRTILYVRTIANFTEDLGNNVKRFWLAD